MNLKETKEKVTLYLLQEEVTPYKEDIILKLVEEVDNEYDENAVYVEMDGVKQGYLSNNPTKTLLPGTMSASEIKDVISGHKAYAKVDVSSLREIGTFAYQYEASVFVEEKAPTEKKAEIEFSLGGGLTTYPGKKALQTEVAKVGSVNIKLTKISDRIVAIFNEAESGFVNASDEDMEVMMQYVEDLPGQIMASAYKVEKGNIKCKIVLQAQVKAATVDLDKSVDRVINEGILTREGVDERIEYCKVNKVSIKSIANMFDSMVSYPEHIKARIKKPGTLYIDNIGIVPRVVAYMNKGKNLRFEGERGIGKNVLADTMAWLFNRPRWEFGSNSQHSNHSILGKDTFKSDSVEEKSKLGAAFSKFLKWIFPIKDLNDAEMKNMETIASRLLKGDKELVFQKSGIIEAVEYGGVIVLDEFNSSLADVMTILNSILDKRRRAEIAGIGVVEAHKNFLAIATENKNYAGTFQIHQGTIDRFVPIVFPKPDSIVSVLQAEVPNANYDIMLQLGGFYNKLRGLIADGTLGEDVLSIRGFIDACDVLDEDVPLRIALIDNVANKADDLDDREAIKDLINLTFLD